MIQIQLGLAYHLVFFPKNITRSIIRSLHTVAGQLTPYSLIKNEFTSFVVIARSDSEPDAAEDKPILCCFSCHQMRKTNALWPLHGYRTKKPQL